MIIMIHQMRMPPASTAIRAKHGLQAYTEQNCLTLFDCLLHS